MISHLRAAAALLTTDDDPAADTIRKIVDGAFDRHSHSCTYLAMTSRGLVAKLRELGYEAEAAFLKLRPGDSLLIPMLLAFLYP